MSLYNKLFGFNPLSWIILAAIDLRPEDCGRFRDCYVVKDAQGKCRIAVYTRNGGGNRAQYMPDFSKHPCYVRDADDEFDNTYATIYFRIPRMYQRLLNSLATEDVSTSEKFKKLIDDIEQGKDSPMVDRAKSVGKEIFDFFMIDPKGE